jgi:hypothetical protein
MEKYFIIKFTGPFGYIKPWAAVRDELTFSQLYLTGSILKGMSQKLFGLGEMNKILRHRLSYSQLIETQERTLPKIIKTTTAGGILKRHIMLKPELYLAFATLEDATIAGSQHLCLCRNEDIVWPSTPIVMSKDSFDTLPGFEYFPKEQAEAGIFHGWDRTTKEDGYHKKQYGIIGCFGEPMRLGEDFMTGEKGKEEA